VAPAKNVEPGARARRIKIQISASPAQARLYLDGKLLPSNPFAWIAEADGSQHIIEAAAEGHSPESAAVLAENDAEVRLSLDPTAATAVAQPSPSRARLPRSAAAPVAVPSAKGPDCNPNFFIDEQGVKRFKVECM
jgi:serine/threonine-protein kinase